MVTVTYQAALLGLAQDLTKHDSPWQPVAVIGMAHRASASDWNIFFLMPEGIEERHGIAADPVAAQVIKNLPTILMERIYAAKGAGVEPDRLLNWLDSQMTDSLQFVWIKTTKNKLSAPKQADLMAAAVRQYGRFLSVAKKYAAKERARKSTPERQYTQLVTPIPRWNRGRSGAQAHV